MPYFINLATTVLYKDLAENVLYVAQEHDHPWLLSTALTGSQSSWVSGTAPKPGSRLQAQVRYRQPPQACIVDKIEEGCLSLSFEQPQWAVTPGQSVVLYDADVCLGGAIIDNCNAPVSLSRSPAGSNQAGAAAI